MKDFWFEIASLFVILYAKQFWLGNRGENV